MVSDPQRPKATPTPPFLAVDRDGWLYGLASEADVAEELEETDIAGGEYVIYDGGGRRVEAVFEGRSIRLKLQSRETHWVELRSAVERFFRDHGLGSSPTAEPNLVIEAVKALRRWGP